MDFTGQKKAYNFMLYTIWGFGTCGFIHGFLLQKFVITYYWIAVGTILVSIITVPSWPYFLQNKVDWKEPPEEELAVAPTKEDLESDDSEEEEIRKSKAKSKSKKKDVAPKESIESPKGESKAKKRNKKKNDG